jgi:hypothetical protein
MLMSNIAAECNSLYGSELNTAQICTAPTGVTEANATTGWTNYFGMCNIFTSDAGDPQLGTYELALGYSNSGLCHGFYAFPTLTDGTVYKINYYAKYITGTASWTSWPIRDIFTSTNIGQRVAIPSSQTAYALVTHYNVGGTYSFLYIGGATSNSIIHVDNISLKTATLCYGSELFTSANAASLSPNEANATTGFTSRNSPDVFTSTTSNCLDGTYCINITGAGNGTVGNEASFYMDLSQSPYSLQTGHKYLIRYSYRHNGVGTKPWMCGFSGALTGGSVFMGPPSREQWNGSTTYTRGDAVFIYDVSLHKYFGCTEGIYGDSGGLSGIYFDRLSIREIIKE